MTDETRTARAYFLGVLSAEESTRLEIAVLADPSLAERVMAAEVELIDEYVEGSLTPLDRGRFESVYMAVPVRASRVRFALELAKRASRGPLSGQVSRSSPGLPMRLLLPMAATLILAAGLWLTLGRPSETRIATAPVVPTPTPIAASPALGTTATPAAMARRATLVLALGMARGASPTPFAIPKDAEVIDLEIDLEGETRFSGFDARLTDASGREIWRNSRETPLRATAEGTLVISVPVSSGIGRGGRFELTIVGRSAGGGAAIFARLLIPFAIP